MLQGVTELRREEIEVQALEKMLHKTDHYPATPIRYLAFVQFIPDITVNSLLLQTEGHGHEGQTMQKLLHQFQDVLLEPKALPLYRNCDHKIPTKHGAEPINLRPYRYLTLQKDALEGIIREMMLTCTIKPSNSPYSSPVILVKKKDEGWRMCVDYSALNHQTIKDKYLIPLIEELLDELHGVVVFSKLDLRDQIRMSPEDVPKTTFKTHDGHYEFVVMHFGVTNSPSTFQNLMNEIFRYYFRRIILVFFDDILVYCASKDDHYVHLQKVLEV